MKAKQYAARITGMENPKFQDIYIEMGKIGKDFYNEFVELKNQRKVDTDESFYNLMVEFDLKFEKFAGLVNAKFPDTIKSDGFIEIVRTCAAKGIIPYLDGTYQEFKQQKLKL